jgi:hypothetical protein
MTVCIAAICSENELDQRIILCRDWRGELPYVGSNDEVYKLKRLADKWIALVAGTLCRAEELCLRLEYSLKKTPFTEENIANELRRVFGEYKRAMSDSFLKNKYGFSFDTLIDKGKDAFGEAFVAECFADIEKLSIPVELIVAGFVEAYDYDDKESGLDPIICSISEANDGDPVVLEDEFSVIGSGANAARTMLFSRNQSADDPLLQTVYTVYEAKRVSETVPGVGDTYSIDVLHSDGSLENLTDAGAKRVREMFSRFGPRPIDEERHAKWFELKKEYFEPWDTKEVPDSQTPEKQ